MPWSRASWMAKATSSGLQLRILLAWVLLLRLTRWFSSQTQSVCHTRSSNVSCDLLRLKRPLTRQSLFVSFPAVPERPEDLIVTAVTKNSISVSWRPPKYDGGAEVTEYVLESRTVGRDFFTRIGGKTKLMDRKFTLTELKEGSSHEFRVSAVNQVGQGKPSFATKPVQCKDELGE